MTRYNNWYKLLLICSMQLLIFNSMIFAQDPFVRIVFNNEVGASKGVGWGDYNNDGYPDIYVTNGAQNYKQQNFLYLNNGDGTFTRITTGPQSTDLFISGGCSWGDFDNDGNLDLYVATTTDNPNDPAKNNILYENNGDGTFTKNTTAGPAVNDKEYTAAVGWGDYNNDGYIDLFIKNGWVQKQANSLYSNNGDGTFTDITGINLVSSTHATFISGFAWGDYDNDGDLDLCVAGGAGPNNAVWRNDGSNTFVKLLNASSESIIEGSDSSGPSWADYDNDGDLDLFMTNFGDAGPEKNFLYRNDGSDVFTKITDGDVVNDVAYSLGSGWADIDNDGDLDLFVGNDNDGTPGLKNFFYLNNGDGTFTKNATSVVLDSTFTYGTSFADYNKDGFLDLFTAREGKNILFRNNEPANGNTNNWINIKCVGTASNYAGIGVKVRAKATINSQVRWQMREISAQNGYGGHDDLRAHFGLGNASIIEELRVEWPSGTEQTLTNVAVNQFLTIAESGTTETIRITAPNGGESWQVGSVHNITWTSNNTSGAVDIEYSATGGSSWNTIATDETDDGSYSWTIPDNPSTNCLVRITDADGTPSDVSDSPFTIAQVTYVLTMAVEPSGSGSTQPAVGDHNYASGTVVEITATPLTGWDFVNWTGDVADPNNSTTTVTMDDNKVVTANFVQQTFTLTMAANPAEGGTTDPSVGAHIYPNGQVVTITANPNSGYSFLNWTGDVANPNNISTTVTMNADKTVTANFQALASSITITAPNGGENWAVGSAHNITWTSQNTSGTVNIDYSTDGGSNWKPVIASTGDDGSHLWTIPNDPSTICKVRVSDTDGNPTDQSDAVFTISQNAFDISGTVLYDAKGRPVSGVSLALTHSGGSGNQNSDESGNYLFTSIPTGNVQIVPSKTDDLREAISGSDALLVLQYLAFLANMDDEQQYAADVTEDGSVSGSDAQAILRYLAFYSDNIGATGQWRFTPSDTSFALNANAIANFKAYLKGDANLNWGEGGTLAKNNPSSAALLIHDISLRDDKNVLVPVKIEPNGETLNTFIFTISYDAASLRFISVENTVLIAGFMVVSNNTEPGKVHFAIAGHNGITTSGDILRLVFEKQDQIESANFDITRAFINDLEVTCFQNGAVNFAQAKNRVIPESFNLDQNYPNPFNPETRISFQLPVAGNVSLKIFNVRGDEICTLINEQREAGYHYFLWNGKDAAGIEVPSGVYLVTIQSGQFIANRKMVKIR